MATYAGFQQEYDAVQSAVLEARLDAPALSTEIRRLEELAAQLDTVERDRAAADLERLTQLLTAAQTSTSAVTPAQSEAMAVAARASDPAGTTDERIARLEEGIEQIRLIAERVTDGAERIVVAQQAEQLTMTASALRLTR